MSKLDVRPLNDFIIIESIKEERITKSGIYIPDNAVEKPNSGIVLAKGPGKKDMPTTVSVGDKVIFKKNSGVEIKLKEKEYLIIKESDIYAIL